MWIKPHSYGNGGKKVIILLDEYDTPMQEAYVCGYWEDLVAFTRSMFNSTFKTNPYMDRAIMTGISRVSRESMFSDLNNLEIVTTTSGKYRDSFGFTEEEVFAAMDEFGLSDQKADVKKWYDGFTFGSKADIYNPWSIINYLDKKTLASYWSNSSSNSLAGKLIREGSWDVKKSFERLLEGYSRDGETEPRYELALTNREVQMMFQGMVRGRERPECFYHGFVLGLMVELKGRYILTSNRESGFGRYDVMLEPRQPEDDAILIEFKVFRPAREKELSDAVAAALEQIEAKGYEKSLTEKGIAKERIRKYGFAFCGKQVLIGSGEGREQT